MTCRDVQERIEAVVAGDAAATDEFRTHVEGCLRCAASLAHARRIEETLSARPAPEPPARFAASIAARIRNERWRSEQQVDRFFNVAVVVGMIAITGGVLALVNFTTVTGTLPAVMAFVNNMARESGNRAAEPAAPVFSTYLLGAGFLVTALLVWWWAEKRMSLGEE
jgi:anti-sigma factor RsiW